jgi:hypothetical protein
MSALGTVLNPPEPPQGDQLGGTMNEAVLPAAIGFCENAVRLRAAHYHEEAERLRSLAVRAPLAKMNGIYCKSPLNTRSCPPT